MAVIKCFSFRLFSSTIELVVVVVIIVVSFGGSRHFASTPPTLPPPHHRSNVRFIDHVDTLFQLPFTASCGDCVAPCGIMWHCVVSRGTVWYHVALCGITWHCVVSCGMCGRRLASELFIVFHFKWFFDRHGMF